MVNSCKHSMASEQNQLRRSIRVSTQQSIKDQPRAKWTLYLTKTLADLMVEQVGKGNRQNNSFGKKAWECICDAFQRKTDLIWDKEQLKNRYTAMRKQYATLKSLLDLNEFSWDESLSMVNATDEVWDEYIKAHPDAESIRTNGCPYYKQLCIIFGESSNAEKYVELNRAMKNENEELFLESPNNEDTAVDFGVDPMFVQDESSSNTEDDIYIPNRQTKCQKESRLNSGGRKQNQPRREDIMARAMVDIAAASKLRAIMVSQNRERFSISKCIEALDEIEKQGLAEGLYYAALDLFEKPNARETFMSIKFEKRLGWLKGKCKDTTSTT